MPKTRLDRIDHRILRLLQQNARLSNKELAAAVGLSPSACHARVQRLLDAEVFRGFHASVDPKAVGIQLQALLFLQLERHGGKEIERFRDRLLERDEVLELYQVGGSQDLILRIAVRDTDHLRHLVLEEITSQESVRHVETSIIFEHRRAPSLPLLEEEELEMKPRPRGG